MLPNIYFVSGAGAGKSYACKYLIDNYQYIQSKFANSVYMLANSYFNMQGKDRKLLQIIGTEVGRNTLGENIWIDRFEQDIKIVTLAAQRMNKTVSFVSDDCRFPNEHEMLKKMGWVGVYLNVPKEIRIQRLIGRDGTAQEETLNHISEIAHEAFKDELYSLDASGTLEQTYQNIETFLTQFKG